MDDLRARTTLFCGIIAFAIALSMALRGRRAVHLSFAAFGTTLAFWYASQALADLTRSEIYVRATAVLTVLLPQFAVRLFGSIAPMAADRQTRRLTRVALALGAPLLAVSLSPYHEAPLSLALVYLYVVGLLAASLIALFRRGQRNPSRAVRDRVRFLVGTAVLAAIFTLADFLAFLGVYLPPIGAVLAIVFLFVLAESLTRPRLADLYELAGRLMVSTAMAFALAGIFYAFIMYLGRFGTMYLNATLAAIVFLVLFEPLQQEFTKRIHQFFFRERYDLETSVAELRRRLVYAVEPDEMVAIVLDGMDRSRRVTSCAIYLTSQEGDGFERVGSIGAEAPEHLDALALRPILDRLKSSLILEDIAREADGPRDDGRAPVLAAAEALGPLQRAVLLAVRIGEEDSVVGLVAIADDRLRDAFTTDEVSLLESVTAQMAVVLANSRLYARLKERDRLAMLGSMAAGLAHEVKNPLGAIKGAAQVLEELGGEKERRDPQHEEFLGIILEETDRLNRVVGSFLDYARPSAGSPVPVDVNAAVRRTLQILSSQNDESVVFEVRLADDLPRAKIDPERLRQVLINLVQNAIQAMSGAGTVTITSQRGRAARASWSGLPGSPSSSRDLPADTIEISVSDKGPGIPQKVLKNLFIPFFTTKVRGSGLGLAISQSIVQNAGGRIQVQTHAGAGTTFTVLLPATDERLTTPPPAPSTEGEGALSIVPR